MSEDGFIAFCCTESAPVGLEATLEIPGEGCRSDIFEEGTAIAAGFVVEEVLILAGFCWGMSLADIAVVDEGGRLMVLGIIDCW